MLFMEVTCFLFDMIDLDFLRISSDDIPALLVSSWITILFSCYVNIIINKEGFHIRMGYKSKKQRIWNIIITFLCFKLILLAVASAKLYLASIVLTLLIILTISLSLLKINKSFIKFWYLAFAELLSLLAFLFQQHNILNHKSSFLNK